MHVFALLAGHGVTVVPRAPFAFERHGGRGGDAVVVTHRPPAGLPRRLVLVPEAGGCRVELGAGVAAAAEVADVTEAAAAPGAPSWTIETSRFSMGWPEGFVLQSGPAPEKPPGFDLLAPGGVLLFPQGPYPTERVADRLALAGPGQRVVGEGEGEGAGAGWIELAYVHELTAWRQRHTLVPVGAHVLVLTLQAPEASVDAPAWKAALEAAETVRTA